MLHLIHDQALIRPFESLRFFDGLDDTDADAMIHALNELIEEEDGESTPEIDFRMNNYNGSIYLLFATLDRVSGANSTFNSKVGYFIESPVHDEQRNNSPTSPTVVRCHKRNGSSVTEEYDDFKIAKNEDGSIKVIKQHHVEILMKPIYTNRSSGLVNKKILKVTNFEPLSKGSTLVLRNVDYFNTAEDSSDEDSSSSESDSDSDDNFDVNSISTGETNASSLFDDEPITPKLLHIPPMTPTTRAGSLTCVTNANTNANSKGRRGHVRNASFTSSGNSFGEGIIKYSRSQIRDMLMQMSLKDHGSGNGNGNGDGDGDDAVIEEGNGGFNGGNGKNGTKGAKGKSKSKNKKRKGGKNSRKNSGSSSSSSDGAFAAGAGFSSNDSGIGTDISIVTAPVQLEVPAGFGKRRKSVRFIEDDVVVECAS
ncbi:unnamed protein product [Ambrosiozyma monospora]|uniref:Unnamed protein product n=1 Tax=Ambrosiozyma monospora TaxID=43982 RepID=A0A9W7DHR9_AMBMO|nr:unnamed protein product [Ambrosiozyma monospora]